MFEISSLAGFGKAHPRCSSQLDMSEPSEPIVLGVAVETPQHAGLAACLDYKSEQMLAPGTLVRIPLGKRDVAGIVWQVGSAGAAAGIELRGVRQVLAALPPLSDAWRQLVSFAAGYYQRGLGELALAVLPPDLRKLDAAQLDTAPRPTQACGAGSRAMIRQRRPCQPNRQRPSRRFSQTRRRLTCCMV